MLKSHFDSVENSILASSEITHHAGHTNHRGTPREIFIKDFLEGHLSEKFAIGTEEIIDASSKPREQRNQIDIVIYRRDYPKLELAKGIYAFLVESVVAIIEVKSLLTEEELSKTIDGPNWVDDKEFFMKEFGKLLSVFEGWGMRIIIVPEDETHQSPPIEIKNPGNGKEGSIALSWGFVSKTDH